MRLGIVLKIMGGMNVERTPKHRFCRCKTIPQHTQSSSQGNRTQITIYINLSHFKTIDNQLFSNLSWGAVPWHVALPQDQPLPERPAMVGPPQTPRTAGAIDACCGSW